MHELPLLSEILLFAVISVGVALLFDRLRLPVLTGILVAGALVGPYGFGLVTSRQTLDSFAELGVALLLFTIGLEFSQERLSSISRRAIWAGLLQVSVTILVVVLISLAFGETLPRAVYFGMVFALSSTAIVLRGLEERAEVDAPHGRLILATLLIQDLAIVPMLLAVPLLSGHSANGVGAISLLWTLLKAGLLVALALIGGRYIVPRVLSLVAATRSREVFLLAVLSLALGTAWASTLAGTSLALGAFLGGIVLARTEMAHRALSEILPLRDVLMSLFFLVMGMLFDWRLIITATGPLLGLLALLLIGKAGVAALSVLFLRVPTRVALLFGVGLAQFGEFGYLLLKSGLAVVPPLVTAPEQTLILSAGLASMILAPLALRLAPHLTAGERLLQPLERWLGARGMDEPLPEHEQLSNHVVLAGYGPSGQAVGRALAERGIPYLVLELNLDTVQRLRSQGEPVYYADVTSTEALRHAQLDRAQALVILISDYHALSQSILAARRTNPGIPILVRTRFTSQRTGLQKLGANVVVVEELESANEMIRQVCDVLCISKTAAASPSN